jgi:WD40 repeat protein
MTQAAVSDATRMVCPAPLEALLRRIDAIEADRPERPWRIREAVTGILRLSHVLSLAHYYRDPSIRTPVADATIRRRLAKPMADGALLATTQQVLSLDIDEERHPVLVTLREFIARPLGTASTLHHLRRAVEIRNKLVHSRHDDELVQELGDLFAVVRDRLHQLAPIALVVAHGGASRAWRVLDPLGRTCGAEIEALRGHSRHLPVGSILAGAVNANRWIPVYPWMTWCSGDSGNGVLYLFSHVDLEGVPQFITYSELSAGAEVSDLSPARQDAARALRELFLVPSVGDDSDQESFRQFSEPLAHGFVSREGLVPWLTTFLADPDADYGSIVGVAGIGKTTIMAALANAVNPPNGPAAVLADVTPHSMTCVHHFCSAALNWHRADVALRLLNHQLAKTFGPLAIISPVSEADPEMREADRFARYIDAAGERFRRDEQQLCICIDAVDESGAHGAPTFDLLRLLPGRLPKGVKCLVTFRIDSEDAVVGDETLARFRGRQYSCLPFDIDEFAMALSQTANVSLSGMEPALIATLHRVSGGVPLLATFLGEVLRRSGKGSLVQFARAGNPHGVFWAWWASLPREQGFLHHRAVLVAATAERAVAGAILCDVLGADAVTVEDVLEELGSVLVRTDQGVTLFHDTLRTFALLAATRAELMECHARLAQAYSGGWKPGSELQVKVAACRPDRACVHWLRAGEVTAAVKWLTNPFLVGLWISRAGVTGIEPLIEELALENTGKVDAAMLSLLRLAIEVRGDALERAPFTVPQHMVDAALASSSPAFREDLSVTWPTLRTQFPPILLMRDRPDETAQAATHRGPVSAFASSGADRFYTVGWDDKIREWSRLDNRCVRARSAGVGGSSLGGEFFCDLWQTQAKDRLLAVPGIAGFESNGLAVVRPSDLSVESRIACPKSYASDWDVRHGRLALRTTCDDMVVLDIGQRHSRRLATGVTAGPVFCSNGERLVFMSAVQGGTLTRLNVDAPNQTEEIRIGLGKPTALLLRDDDHAVSLDEEGTVRLCAFPERSDTVVARFPGLFIAAISVITDSVALGGGGYDEPGSVVLLNAQTFALRWSRNDLAAPVQVLDFDDAQRTLFVGHRDGSITVLDLDQLKPDLRFSSRERADHAAAFSADGRTVVTAGGGVLEHLWFVATGETNSIRFLDAASSRERSRITLPPRVAIEELATSADAATAAVIADAGTRFVIAAGEHASRVSSFVHEATRCRCPICRPIPEWAGGSIKRQGRRRLGALGGGEAPFVRLLPSGEIEAGPLASTGHALTLERVAVSPDGQWAVTGDLGGDLTAYVLGREARTLHRFPGLHQALEVLASGDPQARAGIVQSIALLASNMLPSTRPELEDALRGSSTSSLTPAFHQFFSGVSALAVTADSKRIAVARYDGHVEIWLAPELRLDRVLCRLLAPASHLAFSDDGRHLVAALLESDLVVLGLYPCRQVAAMYQIPELAVLSASPDMRLVVQGSANGDVAIGATAGGAPMARHTLGAGITALHVRTNTTGQVLLMAADASRRVTSFSLQMNRDGEGRWCDGPLWRLFEHSRPQSESDHRTGVLSEESLTVDAATRFVAFWSALPEPVRQSEATVDLYGALTEALAGSRLDALAPTMEPLQRVAAIAAAVSVQSYAPHYRESLDELLRLEHKLCGERPLCERYSNLQAVGRHIWPQLRLEQRIVLSDWLAAHCPAERTQERCRVLLALARLYLLDPGHTREAREVLRQARGLLMPLGCVELQDDYDVLINELHSPVSRLMARISQLLKRRAK